ncbi:NUDIX domain-containing protein [Candidatus Daviesbacteria bacterium]|nr:NUDIX domain-containing protein [Candidatus Daviesbacteria bacterium]
MPEIDSKYPRGVEIVGSAIIENDQGQILLTQSPKWSNKWTLPGGHIEPGETIMEAIIREVEEETGLKLDPVNVIAWGELIDSKDFHRPAHFIYFDVYCRKTPDGEFKLDGTELTDYQWLKPEEALKLDLAESYPETIQKFIDYLNSK